MPEIGRIAGRAEAPRAGGDRRRAPLRERDAAGGRGACLRDARGGGDAHAHREAHDARVTRAFPRDPLSTLYLRDLSDRSDSDAARAGSNLGRALPVERAKSEPTVDRDVRRCESRSLPTRASGKVAARGTPLVTQNPQATNVAAWPRDAARR